MPVTIITGFLGSGKTTLLNHILNTSQDLKVAVLVNEFGDIDIDSQLLTTIDENMVQLTNGCICCTINDDLVEAVYSVLEREEKIDHVVIETTGVADPLPIILTFVSSQLKDVTTLDSIITLVDSETFTPECFQSEAALNQITFGDIVVLNKTDLTTEQKVKELEEWIRDRKWGARLLRSQQGQVPLPLILDTALFDPKAYEAEAKAFAEQEAHDHDHDHHHHDQTMIIITMAITIITTIIRIISPSTASHRWSLKAIGPLSSKKCRLLLPISSQKKSFEPRVLCGLKKIHPAIFFSSVASAIRWTLISGLMPQKISWSLLAAILTKHS